MTPERITPESVRAAFLPLTDAARLGTVLNGGPALARPMNLQFKLLGRTTNWRRSHARVCFRLQQRGQAQAQAPILHGWACLRGATELDLAAPAPWHMVFGDLDLHLWTLPQDTALTGLQALWTLPQGPRPEVVSYRPGERAVLRYARHDRTPEMYAKTFRSAQTASQVHARARRVHAARAFGCAAPLALDPDHAAVWSLGVRGECLTVSLRQGFDARIAEEISRALAALHGLTHTHLPLEQGGTLLAEAYKKLERLRRVLPDSAALFDRLRRDIRICPDDHGDNKVALHGDFHLRQWLRRGHQLTLCDFDEFKQGAPESDLASLCMDLALYGLTAADTAAWRGAFIQAYAQAAPWGLCRKSLQWHLRLQAVNKMHRALMQLHPDLNGRCIHFMNHLDAALAAAAS